MNFPQNFFMNNNFVNANSNVPLINQYNANLGFNNMNNNNFNNQNYNMLQNMQNNNFNNNNYIQNNQMNNSQNFNQMNNSQNFNPISNNEIISDDDLRNKIQKTNSEMRSNNFWIDINQIGLLHSIINFYHNTDNKYLNINEKVQIMNIMNRLNPNISSLKQNNEILEPLHYIHGPKKIIKFINSDSNLYTVKLPKSLTKLDLYSIARTYKSLENTEILLIHNNSIINEEETSIDFISENDYIIIIENRNYPDDSFYDSLKKNISGQDLTHIIFKDENRTNPDISMQFPSNITFFQMMKAFNYRFGYCQYDNIFMNYLFQDGHRKLKEIFLNKYNNIIHYYRAGSVKLRFNIYGKKINIEIKEKSNNKCLNKINIGLLNTNKLLLERIEADLENKVKKILYNNEILNIKDEMSLKSLGIKDGCECFIELQ